MIFNTTQHKVNLLSKQIIVTMILIHFNAWQLDILSSLNTLKQINSTQQINANIFLSFFQFQTSYRSPDKQNTRISKIAYSCIKCGHIWLVAVVNFTPQKYTMFSDQHFHLCCVFHFKFFLLFLSCFWPWTEHFLTETGCWMHLDMHTWDCLRRVLDAFQTTVTIKRILISIGQIFV